MLAYINLWIEIHRHDLEDSSIVSEDLMTSVVHFGVANGLYWQRDIKALTIDTSNSLIEISEIKKQDAIKQKSLFDQLTPFVLKFAPELFYFCFKKLLISWYYIDIVFVVKLKDRNFVKY